MIVGSLLGIAAELIEAGGIASVDDGSSTSLTRTLMYLTEGVGLLVSIIAVAMWIHRAHANLYEAGAEGLQFTPGWAVGWYFIPFANLFKPFQAMRELWTRSHAEDDPFGKPAPGGVCLVGRLDSWQHNLKRGVSAGGRELVGG
jgi:hypothetical protein